MKPAEYSPVALPSLGQQEISEEGLGRAMQWAIAGKLDEGLLLDACFHDNGMIVDLTRFVATGYGRLCKPFVPKTDSDRLL